jgi:autotransporter-associated beta strand protein
MSEWDIFFRTSHNYIRLPIGAEEDLLRVVSQGEPSTFTETVGTFTETAVVQYEQDRSRYVGADDLDMSPERFTVSYVDSGVATLSFNDGTEVTVNTAPVWASSVDTEAGVDVNSSNVVAPLGFLATSSTISDQNVTGSRQEAVFTLSDSYVAPPYILHNFDASNEASIPAQLASVAGYQAVTITSAEEQAAVFAATRVSGPFSGLVIYVLGAFDIQDGIPVWHTGETSTYTNWESGPSPSNSYVRIRALTGAWLPSDYSNILGYQNFGNPSIAVLEPIAPNLETFFTYQYNWASTAQDLEDTRLTLNYQWVSNQHDLFTEVPVVELVNARLPVIEPVNSTEWVSQPIIEQQTLLRPTRVLVDGPAVSQAAFGGDALGAQQAIVIDAVGDVSLSGMVTARNADGTAGAVSIDAGGNFTMSGAKPDGAEAESLAAVAGLTAVTGVTINTGGSFTLAESINITADDGDAAGSTQNAIIVNAATSAIIRGSLNTTNTLIGEVTVNAGDDIELKGEIVSGHIVNVAAGMDGVGGISSDIFGNIRTLGSEVHLSAGADGGDLMLTDLFVETSGPLTVMAPSGSVANTGGLLLAGAVTASAMNGVDLVVSAGALDAEVTGTGSLSVFAYGDVAIGNLVTADGGIAVQGTGALNVGTVTAGGANSGLSIVPLGASPVTVSGSVSTSGPLTMTVEGGQTITTAASELTLIVTTPGDITVLHPGTEAFTLSASVLDGSLTVQTGGDLIVPEVRLQSNRTGNDVTLESPGDVLIGLLVAGDYSLTVEDADALRADRGMAPEDLFTSLSNVTVTAGGRIGELTEFDDDVDIVAGTLTLIAETGITELELAVNELTEVTTTTGSISLSDTDGAGELSLGLDVIEATAPAGSIELSAGGSLLLGAIVSGAVGQPLILSAQSGSLAVLDHAETTAGLTSAGAVMLTAGGDLSLDAPLTADGDVSIVSGGLVLAASNDFVLSTTGALSIDGQSTVSLGGTIAVRGSASIVSQTGDVAATANVQAQGGGALDEVSISSGGLLVLAGGTFGEITSRLEFHAGTELITGRDPVFWTVTGADGVLDVSAGGDLIVVADSVLTADHISLASIGYLDEEDNPGDGNLAGGNVAVLGTLAGVTAVVPQQLSLSAAKYLHLTENITSADVLTLDANPITISEAIVLQTTQLRMIANGGDDPDVLATLSGSIGTVSANRIALVGGATLQIEHDETGSDQLLSDTTIELLDGLIAIDTPPIAGEIEDAGAATFNGDITGAGGLTKTGTGSLVLDGVNTFTGDVLVEDGTLFVSSTTGAEIDFSVVGGVLSGTGTIEGAVTVGDGGTLSPGSPGSVFGTLTLNDLTFAAGSILDLDVANQSGTQFDEVVVNGVLTIDPAATFALTANGFHPQEGDSFTLLRSGQPIDTPIGGAFGNLLDLGVISGTFNGETYFLQANYAGGDGNDLTLTAIEPPRIDSLARSAAEHTFATSVTFDVTVSEAVTGLSAANFEIVSGGDVTGASITSVTGSGTSWTVTVNAGSGDGTLGLNLVNSSGVVDVDGFALFGIPHTGDVYTIDRTPPTVTVTPHSGVTNAGQITFTFQFSEAVSGFDSSDISLANGSAGTFATIDSTTYTLVVTPTGDGAVTASVAADRAQDLALNGNLAGSGSITSDRTSPTVSISFGQDPLTAASPAATVTFQFSEPVADFDVSDVAFSGGTLTDFLMIDGDTFTATFTAPDDVQQTGTVSIGAEYEDLAGNIGTAGSQSVEINTQSPTVTVDIEASQLGGDVISTRVTFEFSDNVFGFDLNDVTVVGGRLTDFTAVDGNSFTATFTANNSINLTGSVSVGTGYTDVSGNAGGAGSDTVVIDTARPKVTVTFPDEFLNIARNSSVVQIEFTENVIGFDISDLAIIGGTLSDFTAIDGSSFVVTFTARDGIYSFGSVKVSGAYTDEFGNAGSSGLDTVEFDTAAPTVNVNVVASALNADNRVSDVTFTFNEAVIGFSLDDVVVSGGELSNFTGSGRTYSATLTATDGQDAVGTVSVTDDSYTDTLGNSGTGGSDTVSMNTQMPTVTVNIVDSSLNGGDRVSNVTFEFSENVFGFTAADVMVSNGLLSNFAVIDGNSYTARFTASDGLDATGSVSVGTGYTDTHGNTGSPGSDTVAIDTLNPELAITPNGSSGNSFPIVFTFKFNEDVVGFTSSDVSITNGSAGALVAVDASTYTLAVTPTAPGTISVSVADGAVKDAAGNDGSGASASVSSTVAPIAVDLLEGGGSYELLMEGADLVLRLVSGAILLRLEVTPLTELTINGSSDADTVTVLNSGTVVATPIVFHGGDGADVFDGTLATGALALNGDSGNDTLLGGRGNDTLRGGAQADFLQGGDGNDFVDGQGSSDDTVGGGFGDDTINGGAGNDVLQDGADTNITVTNTAMTGLGNDVLIDVERALITGGSSANRIDLSNFFVAGFTTVTVLGGEGDDTIIGSRANDLLRGDQGDDLLIGGAGNDYLAGGAGADSLDGGAGNDRLRGQGGSGDRLTGGAGINNLNGGAGNDILIETISGSVKIDRANRFETSVRSKFTSVQTLVIYGSSGSDLIDASGFAKDGMLLRIYGGDGNDTLLGSRYADLLDGGTGNDILNGGGGDDTLLGGAGNDGLSGYTGNDVLSGGTGNDTLIGHDGADTLFGEAGTDTLVGGGGTSIEGNLDDELTGGSESDFFDGDMPEFQDFTGEDTAGVFTDFANWVDQI